MCSHFCIDYTSIIVRVIILHPDKDLEIKFLSVQHLFSLNFIAVMQAQNGSLGTGNVSTTFATATASGKPTNDYSFAFSICSHIRTLRGHPIYMYMYRAVLTAKIKHSFATT